MAGVAYPWLVAAITREPIQIALIGVANRLLRLLFSPRRAYWLALPRLNNCQIESARRAVDAARSQEG